MSNNEMFVKDPLDPDYGRISYEFLPTGVIPPAVPDLNAVLTAGNQALGVNIDAQGGDVLCNTLRTISIAPVGFPIVQEVAVEGNLAFDPLTQIGFGGNAKITCNYAVSAKTALETTNASGNAIYKVAEGNIQYETLSKLLTVNPASIPPSPLLPTQGLTVNGVVSVSGLIDGTDLKLKGTNPSVDFFNSSNVQKASLDYVELTDKITLTGTNVVAESTGTGAPRLLLDATAGSAELRANNLPVRLRRYSATGTTLNTELTLSGSGVAEIKAPVSANNPTLKLTNADTSISASLDFDSFSVNLRAPDVPIYLQYIDGFGNPTNSLDVGANTIDLNIFSAGQYNFGNKLSYNGADTMLVDANKAEQVPTNQIAVAQYFQRENILPVPTIDNTNPPLAEFKQTSSFTWRYSGTGVGSSYCLADRVEVIFDICIIGALNDTFQWGIKLVDPTSATEYASVGAFASYDTATPATGLEYTTAGNRTNPSGQENHTASIRCYFDGVNSIADGNSVYFNIFVISRNAGTHTTTDGWYSFRIRPTTRIP
jgi:hypothetical protein